MASFTALNVEPEDNVEDEIDDTKEIQIEEAFKLYQNALKLHSQGPSSYEEAEKAYEELFASEVFKYPEVISDFTHEQSEQTITLSGPVVEVEVPLITGNAADSAANSLPQLIYLAHKNRAQFVLDVAQYRLHENAQDDQSINRYYYKYCLKSFEDSASALERDDTDLDLWKKAARIADILSSQRLVRFCLESVLAGDDEGDDDAIDLSGLDEAFAVGELKKVLKLIQDDLACDKPETVKPRSDLMQLLQQSNDPFPFLPKRPVELQYFDEKQKPLHFETGSTTIEPADQSLQALGLSLLNAIQDQEEGRCPNGAAGMVKVSLGDSQDDEQDKHMSIDEVPAMPARIESLPENVPLDPAQNSPSLSPRSPASFHSAQDAIVDEEIADPSSIQAEENTEERVEDQDEHVTQHKDSVNVLNEVRLPTRKRSSMAAGIDESESRTKSKRLRARESLLELAAQEEEVQSEQKSYNQEQLRILENADEVALSYLDQLLSKAGAEEFGPPLDIRAVFWRDEEVLISPLETNVNTVDELLLNDMRQVFSHWTDDKSSAIMHGNSNREAGESSAGLSLFLRHLRSASNLVQEKKAQEKETDVLHTFARTVNNSSMTVYDVSTLFLLYILTAGEGDSDRISPYMAETWSADFKDCVLQILEDVNTRLQAAIRGGLDDFAVRNKDRSRIKIGGIQVAAANLLELVQSLFEIHLDLLAGLSTSDGQPESHDHDETHEVHTQQLLLLEKWAQLATTVMQVCLPEVVVDSVHQIVLRYVWTSTKYAGHIAGNDKSHILICLQDLRALLEKAGDPIVTLPNNTTTPQISIAAVDQEISRLRTLDFFMGVFEDDNDDPLALIMKLEPLLEIDTSAVDEQTDNPTEVSAKNQELRAFLDSGDASLRLFLWRRLQSAYTAISYNPKVVSCLLRSFEIVVTELRTERHSSMDEPERHLALLRWIRDSDDLISKVISKINDDAKVFESLDEAHFKSSTKAVVQMLRLVYGFVLYDDAIRVGRISPPALRPSSLKQFEKSRDRFREVYVRLWTLLFHLLKEATLQFPDSFERPAEQLAEYLRNVHNAFGHRQYCKQCNKVFVKLVKAELLALESDIDYSYDIAQILYDMYQLRFSPGVGDADHGCIPELLRDKTTAMTLVPLIMTYARRFNPKDLIKSDLKTTIDKIQACLGQIKTSPSLSYNRKSISAFLKSAIDPQAMYRAMKGLGDLMTKPVSGDYAKIAASGWYLLLGQLSLAKFKSIKRVNPTGTDDLDTAATFLRHDLEHNMYNWQSWYCLAQVFDAKIEDNLIWNSTKLNESRTEIATLERSAINAYTMAIAIALRIADDTSESVQQLSDMFADLATRLYASSRPPLSMEAFSTDKHMRHLSSSLDRSMSKAPFIHPFRPYAVWNFAAALLRKRFRSSAKEWFYQYALGKCLWKMYQSPDNAAAKRPVTIEDVLDAFTEAVEAVPKKEKSTEYILEPHYKLVSVVHKLVHRNLLDANKALEYLGVTQFSKGARTSEDEHGNLEWEPYLLDILKKLGTADKSNWHHRITARAAHVIYDGEPNFTGALGAKHQFTQQIFTKTMTMQVWKPEYERPGRHYVYTGRYLTFFVHLLDQLSDRLNMEQLVRRIRRKTTDFLDHPKIWEQTALTYVKMLRRAGPVPDGKERALFDKISYEDFTKMSEKLEKWTHEPDVTSIFLEIIHDAIELKKLNNSLMKGPAIDDLIGDAYACLYEYFISQLPAEELEPPKPTLVQGTFINLTPDSAPTGDDKVDRMRLNNLLSAQIDGPNSGFSSVISTPAGAGVPTPDARATPPVDPVHIPTPTKPGRVKTITKREVQRKAEAALNRQAMAKTSTLGRRVTSELPSRNNRTSKTPDGKGDEATKDAQQDGGDTVANLISANASRQQSEDPEIDEDEEDEEVGTTEKPEAGDGSELSELDDDDIDKQAGPLFLNASTKKRKAEDEEDEELDEGNAEEEEEEVEEDDEVEDGGNNGEVGDSQGDDDEVQGRDEEDNDADDEENEDEEDIDEKIDEDEADDKENDDAVADARDDTGDVIEVVPDARERPASADVADTRDNMQDIIEVVSNAPELPASADIADTNGGAETIVAIGATADESSTAIQDTAVTKEDVMDLDETKKQDVIEVPVIREQPPTEPRRSSGRIRRRR